VYSGCRITEAIQPAVFSAGGVSASEGGGNMPV
jgi:hypothetical protein